MLKGSRLVIPQQLRKDTLQQLHRSHMGVEATLRRARDTVFWPGINAVIQQLIDNCEACQSFKPAQQRERFQAHERPSLPWAKVATDLFAFEGRNYMVTVDYCTNFWEVDYLGQDTTSRSVINKLRAHFARHGTPQELVTDNGPQFTSREFQARSQGGFGGCGRTPLFSDQKKKNGWCPRLAAARSGAIAPAPP